MRTVSYWMAGLVCAVSLSTATAAWAQEADRPGQPVPDRVDEMMGKYNLHPAFDKLGRGTANFLGGWLEIPLNIQKRYAANDTAGSLFTGTAHGIFRGLLRTVVGAYEVVTFFLPYPENFAPILPTLEYYQKSPPRQPLLLE
jgi:putative exosortase-associated protein (TIGR04073 family)